MYYSILPLVAEPWAERFEIKQKGAFYCTIIYYYTGQFAMTPTPVPSQVEARTSTRRPSRAQRRCARAGVMVGLLLGLGLGFGRS